MKDADEGLLAFCDWARAQVSESPTPAARRAALLELRLQVQAAAAAQQKLKGKKDGLSSLQKLIVATWPAGGAAQTQGIDEVVSALADESDDETPKADATTSSVLIGTM